jgi:hypothetical protein
MYAVPIIFRSQIHKTWSIEKLPQQADIFPSLVAAFYNTNIISNPFFDEDKSIFSL